MASVDVLAHNILGTCYHGYPLTQRPASVEVYLFGGGEFPVFFTVSFGGGRGEAEFLVRFLAVRVPRTNTTVRTGRSLCRESYLSLGCFKVRRSIVRSGSEPFHADGVTVGAPDSRASRPGQCSTMIYSPSTWSADAGTTLLSRKPARKRLRTRVEGNKLEGAAAAAGRRR